MQLQRTARIQLTPGQAPWAHGKAERAIQRIQRAFTVHANELGEYDPSVILALATRAANVVEDVHGYSYAKHGSA